MAFTYCPAPEALPPFDLTEAQYRQLASMRVLERTMLLQDMIDGHAFANRKVIGLYGSVAPHGLRKYAEEFHANLPAFMVLANGAYTRAVLAYERRAA